MLAEKVTQLWGEKVEYEKVTKALLGDYYDHLIWRPAVQRMMTFNPVGGTWAAQLATIDSDRFVARKREEVTRLYSALSKGIHHEFVMPPGTLYDRSTVVDLVQRTVHTLADIGLASQFVALLMLMWVARLNRTRAPENTSFRGEEGYAHGVIAYRCVVWA